MNTFSKRKHALLTLTTIGVLLPLSNLSAVELIASAGVAGDYFGWSSGISGATAIVGARGNNSYTGAAYLFDTTTGEQTFKLTASDGATGDYFGRSSGISGATAIVGAYGNNSNIGAAYLFDTTTGTQTVKLTASDGATVDRFGYSVAIGGDSFVVGAYGWSGSTGKAYTGSVSSMTTLDDGSNKVISGISFVSSVDWIVGQNTSGNTVRLSAGDAANITESGKAVYVGQNAGSNNNTLIIAGTIVASEIHIGSLDGNRGNLLQFESTADYSGLDSIYLTVGNALDFEMAWSTYADMFSFLGGTELWVQEGIVYTFVTMYNYQDLIDSGLLSITRTLDGGMLIMLVPEPSEVAALFGLFALGFAAYRRRS